MDIAREICNDSFYTVNSGLPRVPLTAVKLSLLQSEKFKFLPISKQLQVDLHKGSN